jgi:hypothetical protein
MKCGWVIKDRVPRTLDVGGVRPLRCSMFHASEPMNSTKEYRSILSAELWCCYTPQYLEGFDVCALAVKQVNDVRQFEVAA